MDTKPFDARSSAPQRRDEPGPGDDVPCVKCGAVALDTGLECAACGNDNYEAVTGKPFPAMAATRDVERCRCGFPAPCTRTVPVGFCRVAPQEPARLKEPGHG